DTTSSATSRTLFFLRLLQPPRSPLFPYTTLFRSRQRPHAESGFHAGNRARHYRPLTACGRAVFEARDTGARAFPGDRCQAQNPRDRKSTRLNSSHVEISYAVFCLKKKRKRLTSPT